MTILGDLKAGRLVVVPPVSVKPLEWTDDASDFGGYKLTTGAGLEAWRLKDHNGRLLSKHMTRTGAEAAAQADYEARILSSLAAPPDHTTALLSLVEGMERAAENWQREKGEILSDYMTMTRAETERRKAAEAKLAEALTNLDALSSDVRDTREMIVEANAKRRAAEAKVDALREALAPFAKGAEAIEQALEDVGAGLACAPDDWNIDTIDPAGSTPVVCTMGDLRRARALTQEQNNG